MLEDITLLQNKFIQAPSSSKTEYCRPVSRQQVDSKATLSLFLVISQELSSY